MKARVSSMGEELRGEWRILVSLHFWNWSYLNTGNFLSSIWLVKMQSWIKLGDVYSCNVVSGFPLQ